MSIADKLKELKEAKEAIKGAIIQKGVEILESDTFKSYADRISEIVSGSSTSINALTPANFNGLSIWFDATLNTRSGFDETKKYVEPLIVTPNDVETTTSTYTMAYKSTSSATWAGKFLNLGSSGAFKLNHCFHNTPMTIEAVYKFSTIPTDSSVFRLWHTGKPCLVVYGKGSSSAPGRFWVTGGDNNLPLAEANKLYYITVRYSSAGLTININDEFSKTFSSTLEAASSTSYFGIGTAPGTSATFSDSTYTNGMQFGMVRCWNRLLTDEEISNNYKEIKTRFEG